MNFRGNIVLGIAAAPCSSPVAGVMKPVSTVPPAAADDATTSDSPDATVAPSGDQTAPTIAPDVPEALLPGVGPVAIIGDALPELPQTGGDPALGMQAPVIVAETPDGQPVTIDPGVDGPTWIVFLAHWCPHCNDEIPVINELRDDGRIPDGVNVVGVSTAVSPDRPNWPPDEWLDDKDWTYTAILDGVDVEASQFMALAAYGVNSFPFSVLVDGDGSVVARWSGGRPGDELASLLTSNLTLG